MKCPKCSSKTRIKDSRQAGDRNSRRRTHVCEQCGHRFRTVERLEEGDVGHAGWITLACVSCGASDTRLAENHLAGDGVSVQRVYECGTCGQRTPAVECVGEGIPDTLALHGPMVVTADGDWVPYDRARLARGLAHLRGPHVDARLFAEMVGHVEEMMTPVSTVRATDITGRVLEFLRERSPAAHILHALRLGKIRDISDLRKELDSRDE